MSALREEMVRRARRALEDNARHDQHSLWVMLEREFPEAEDFDLDYALEQVL